ncbi:MAG TPA: prolyl oligopeptidase family serine peptidase [Ignavibacteriaceae bacterium]|nr:prolyl oligopeptidase family serine peptidase [Ignavibacteriaceae bacterium]
MIIDKKEVHLNNTQTKMLISGWSEDAFENSVVEKITYESDGLKVKGYAAYPKNLSNEKLPCIIWNRGGYHNKGAIDHFTAKGIYGQIASWGYFVFASQYRGNHGGEGQDMIGGDDVNDIINLKDAAKEYKNADTNIWGMEGWSRGGMMSLLVLMKNKDFKCVVLSGAITDFYSYGKMNDTMFADYKDFLSDYNLDDELRKRTIINKVDKLPDIPYLIMHGKKDESVPVEQSMKFSEELKKRNIYNKLILYDEGDHYLKGYRREVESEKKAWFGKYLKNF